MEKAPVYETGECRFDPCRRRSARRSSVDESTALRRRGSHVRVVPARHMSEIGPCSSASQSASPVRTRSWVRLPPRAQHAAVVQRTRRRALNPEAGVRLPVAVLDARSSNRKDVGLLLRLWGFESSSGSASPGGRGSRHAAADRVTGVRVPPGRPTSIRCDGTGILPHQQHPAGRRSRCKPEGQQPACLVPTGSRIADLVVVVQRRGCEHATLVMRVRLPPTTPHQPRPTARRG